MVNSCFSDVMSAGERSSSEESSMSSGGSDSSEGDSALSGGERDKRSVREKGKRGKGPMWLVELRCRWLNRSCRYRYLAPDILI